MSSDRPRLGIDFGTSNTVAVVRAADGRTRTLLVDGSPLLPSAVFAERDGGPPGSDTPAEAVPYHLIVGRDALHGARLDPARFEPNPKRRVDEGNVLLGEQEVPVVDLITAVLARVVEECTRALGPAEPEVTLTCPAVWGATRREVLAEAARKAGLDQVRLVVEPVAAATYFAQVLEKEVPVGSVVVVHDFGAGTFDASVVAHTSSGFEVLAVDGRDDIGGLDVDAAIVEHLAKTYEPKAPQAWARLTNPTTVEERRAKLQFWDDVRVAKERLSRNPTADLLIPLADIEVHLTRPELEELAEPILAQTVEVTEGVLRWANLVEGRIAGVFLVGGASRIPLMSTLLFRALGEAPVAIEQPELVVAEGSILAGALTVGVAAPAAPGPTTGLQPKIPADAWGSAGPPSVARPGEIPPVPAEPEKTAPGSAGQPALVPSTEPSPAGGVTPVSPAPWIGRVMVPGARAPGQVAPAGVVSSTMPFQRPAARQRPTARNAYPRMVQAYQRPDEGYRGGEVNRRRGRARRVIGAILITLLLIAVPVVAGIIAYGLAVGDGFFDGIIPAGFRI